MQWIRSHLSFANSISMIALFVALGGTSLAAVTLTKNSVGAKQIKKNAVRASEIKRNAVGASEIRSNAVASGDVADNGIGGSDLSDNSVGAGELSDNSVGGGEVTDDSLTATDITGSSLDSEISPDVIARVQPNGTLLPNVGTAFPPGNKGIADENIEKPAATTGIYCIKGLPSNPRSAMVASDNTGASTAAQNAVVVSAAVERGNNLNGCATTPPTQVRVVATNVDAAAAAADKGFILWLEY